MTHSANSVPRYPHRLRLIELLESKRDSALKDAEGADTYSRKQLLRYVEAMEKQINTVKNAGDYA